MSRKSHAAATRTDDLDPVASHVWDLPVRVFHWSLVALLIGAVVSVKVGGNAMVWHLRCGYAILTLVLFRFVWGVVGTHHARFASFVRGPGAIVGYARSIVERRHESHTGHNPLGGIMIVVMLVALLAQALLGLFANDDIATDGPLARLVSKEFSDALTSWHRRVAWLIVALVAAHISAVGFYLVAFKENLVRPMVTGKKTLRGRREPAPAINVTGRAAPLLALCAGIVWLIVTRS